MLVHKPLCPDYEHQKTSSQVPAGGKGIPIYLECIFILVMVNCSSQDWNDAKELICYQITGKGAMLETQRYSSLLAGWMGTQ